MPPQRQQWHLRCSIHAGRRFAVLTKWESSLRGTPPPPDYEAHLDPLQPNGNFPELDQLVAHIVEQYCRGRTIAQVAEDLVALGVDPVEAVVFVGVVVDARRAAQRASGIKSIGCAALNQS